MSLKAFFINSIKQLYQVKLFRIFLGI